MAFVYNTAANLIANGTIDLDTTAFKVMLVTSTYIANRDNDFVAAGGASDPDDAEIVVSGYTGGFGGSGRKAAVITTAVDKTNDRAEVYIVDLTWTALGAGATIAAAILIQEITNDAASRLIAYFDVTATATNGGDITLDFDAAEGAIRLTTV